MMLYAMNPALLEWLGKYIPANAGIRATSVAMSLAVKPSICHKIATMICELRTATTKTVTPQGLKESLIIHLFEK